MSYRNPKQFVDTETSKYYSNLQKTFSGITDDYIKQLNNRRAAEAKRLAKAAEENKKLIIARNKYENETGSDINGATAITPRLFDDAAQERLRQSIDKAADISTDMFASQEQKTYKQNVDGLNEVIIRDQTNLASYKEQFEEASGKEGQMGGYSRYNDPKQTAFVSAVLGGGLKGKSSFKYDLTKPGGAETMYSWKGEGDTGDPFKMTGSMIAEIAANPDRDLLIRVPDEAVQMEQTINIFGRQTDEKGDPTAAVQEDLYIGQDEKFRIIRDGKKVIKQYYKEPNMDLLGDKIKQKVVASVEALSSNKDLVSNEQIALYNWFQDQKTEDKKPVIGFNEFNEASQEDRDIFLNDLSAEYSAYAMKKYFTGNTELATGTEEIVEPEEEKPPTEGAIKRKIAEETAETVFKDMLESPKSYFKDRKINGKKVSDVRIVPSTVGRGGEKVGGRILEIGYESGTSTTGGERTIFTDEMTFDLDDPVRVRTLIDMLPEGDDLKTSLKKLTGKKNPLLNLNN